MRARPERSSAVSKSRALHDANKRIMCVPGGRRGGRYPRFPVGVGVAMAKDKQAPRSRVVSPRSRVVRKGVQRGAGLHAELGAKLLEVAPVLILLLDAHGAIQY